MSGARAAAACAVLWLVPSAAPAAQLSATPSPGRVWHITLRGDLDCHQLAQDTEDELRRANDAGAGLILLELDGDRSRADVVWEIGSALGDSDAPVCVWLHDPRSRRVGRGQLLLGLLADTCAVGPRTRVAHESADDLAALAPDDTDWEQVYRELSGALYGALKDRAGDPEPAATLVALDGPLWIVRTGSTARLTTSDPADSAAAQVAAAEPAPDLRLTSDDLVSLAWATGPHASIAAVMTANGKTGASRTERTLESGLADARERLERTLERADQQAAAIDTLLDLRPRDSRVVTERDYAEAGARAQPLIAASREALQEAEALCETYPELTKLPAPGATTVATTGRVNASRWRSAFQERRDRLDALERRAMEHLARGRR